MRIKIERLEFEVEPETVEDVADILFGPEKDSAGSPRAAMIQTVAALLEQYLKYAMTTFAGRQPSRKDLELQFLAWGWTPPAPIEAVDETQAEFLERVRKEAATGKHGAPTDDPEPSDEQNDGSVGV